MRIAVFASGSGSNFEAIQNAIERKQLDASIVLCVTNKSTAGVLARANKYGIPSLVLDPKAFPVDAHYVRTLLEELALHNVDFIALAGYLRKIPSEVIQAFHHRMLNIHPSLLPAFGGKGFYGARVHQAVLEAGVRWTGVTIHLVDEAYDTGPIVLQEPVLVQQDDTVETLAARVLQKEHRLYPEALRLFAQNKITLQGRKVLIQY